VLKPGVLRARLAAIAVFLVTLAIYATLAPRLEQRLDPLTGDEPFYVMTAHNLLAGRGLDETVSWANADWRELYPVQPLPADWQGWAAFPIPLPPHDSKGTVPPGLYSKHGLGLALLIAPFWAGGKRAAVVLFLNALGALVAVNVFLLAFEASAKLWTGFACWLALAFSNPLMSYSYLIFPEIPAALLIVYAFRRIRQPVNNGWQTAGIALSIALLPWLHARFALLAVPLGVYWFWKHFWQTPKLHPVSILPLLVPSISAAALLDYYFYLYRSFLPNAQDHSGSSDVLGTLNGMVGLFLDQQWGLVVAAPVYVLALSCVVAMLVDALRNSHVQIPRSEVGWWLAVTVPYFLLIANYRLWWGEWCPPARYLVAILPLLALPLGLVAGGAARPLIAVGLPMALAGWAIMAVFMYDPQLMYNQPTGQAELFLWLRQHTGLDLTGVLPSFITFKQ
jgi:hypothetical protein